MHTPLVTMKIITLTGIFHYANSFMIRTLFVNSGIHGRSRDIQCNRSLLKEGEAGILRTFRNNGSACAFTIILYHHNTLGIYRCTR